MAEAAAVSNPGMDRYNKYYNTVLAQLQQSAGPERSDSQIKNYLQKMIRPTYDQAIAQRNLQTGQANAAIDTDAASRGMGTSTWVTDAKNRQQQQAARDIANLNSNYNSTLYEALLAQLQQRDQNRLSLMGQAQSIAGNMYDRWKAEDDALKAAGAGGGGAGGGGSGHGRGSGNGGDDGDVDSGYGTGNSNPLFKTLDTSIKSAADQLKATLAQQDAAAQAADAARRAQAAADKQKQNIYNGQYGLTSAQQATINANRDARIAQADEEAKRKASQKAVGGSTTRTRTYW